MKILHAILLFVCITFGLGTTLGYAQQTGDFYFYSPEEIQQIKKSAHTSWGKPIVDKLKNTVLERMKFPMEIPVLEGGHGHHYFCPVHNTQFVFDWYSPKAHLCKTCNKTWSGVDYYDWAWVNFVHGENLKFLTANMYLYLITDEEQYASNIKSMLLDLSAKYPGYIEHDRERKSPPTYAGKMFSQSLDEAVWAIDAARAYLVASKYMTTNEQKQIEKGFLYPCATLLMKQNDKANWQVWHNGGITALGIALKNDSIVNVALNKSQYGYHAMMKKNIYADGWWNEGSVVYHFYPLRGLLLTAEAVRCRNISLYDEKLYNMFISPINMLYPDLTFPSQNDGWYGISLVAQASLYEIVSLRYKEPRFTRLLELCNQRIPRSTPDALINGTYLSEEPKPLNLKSHLFPDLGVGVLRSENRTVTLKYGPDGGIHGHPDKLTISIHDGKQEILPDLGTTAYGVPDCILWYQKTFAHSTVTVDEKSQTKSTGVLKQFVPANNGGMIEASANNAYQGIEMSRKLNLKGNKLSDLYTCKSENDHVYDYVLILTEPINFGGQQDTTLLTQYERIRDVKHKKMNKQFTFKTHNATVTIQVDSETGFDLISGTAPGVPPTGVAEGKDAYPLLVRVKGKKLHIETTWLFNK